LGLKLLLIHHLHLLTPTFEKSHGIERHILKGRRRILASSRRARKLLSSRIIFLRGLESYSGMGTCGFNRARITSKKFSQISLVNGPLFSWEGEDRNEGRI
jgi:hypothetical protein